MNRTTLDSEANAVLERLDDLYERGVLTKMKWDDLVGFVVAIRAAGLGFAREIASADGADPASAFRFRLAELAGFGFDPELFTPVKTAPEPS